MKAYPYQSHFIQLYRGLIMLYPQDHRIKYGDEMVILFRDMVQDAYQQAGYHGVFSLAFRVLYDTALNAIKEYFYKEGGNLMNIKLNHIGGFELKEIIGDGSMGVVYQSQDPDTDDPIVVKVLTPEHIQLYADSMSEKHMKEWYFHEASLLEKCDYPGIPKFYRVGKDGENTFIAIELVDGRTLLEVLQDTEIFLTEAEVIHWASEVCDILTYLHHLSPSIIFRDLKPGKIMIGSKGKLYLIGFMVARTAGKDRAKVGTKGYAAPEQYRGDSDPSADIYGLGATMHHLLTRRDPRKEEPFSFETALPRSLNPIISEELEDVIMTALRYDPAERYQSIYEMKTALLSCV